MFLFVCFCFCAVIRDESSCIQIKSNKIDRFARAPHHQEKDKPEQGMWTIWDDITKVCCKMYLYVTTVVCSLLSTFSQTRPIVSVVNGESVVMC